MVQESETVQERFHVREDEIKKKWFVLFFLNPSHPLE